MPVYIEGQQVPVPLEIFVSGGASRYTTSGSPPTILVSKNLTGAPASATGTLSYAGSGLWYYTPGAGEVSAPCRGLYILWDLTGVQPGGVFQVFENDFTAARAGYLTGDAFVRLGAPAGASVSADIAAIKSDTEDIIAAGPGGGGGSMALVISGAERKVECGTSAYELLAQDGDSFAVSLQGESPQSSARGYIVFANSLPDEEEVGTLLEANEISDTQYELNGVNAYGISADAGQQVTFILRGTLAPLP